MKIQEAIRRLQELQNTYGPEIPVYFDCPSCGQSFTPGKVTVQAIHLKGEK